MKVKSIYLFFGIILLFLFTGCDNLNQSTYIVTYDGNGYTAGTIPIDSNKYIEGATVIALDSGAALDKAGYVFSSWNTVVDGSGINCAPGTGFAMPGANVTLYAQWVQNGSVLIQVQ